jgi:hypothetical protein
VRITFGYRRRQEMKIGTRIAVLLAMVIGGWAWAESGDTNQAPTRIRLELDLVDGSHIIGVPKMESVPVQTSYAKMDIALKQIRSIAMAKDHENGTLALRNGDNLKGVVALGPVSLDTLFGNVKVGIEHVNRITVVQDDGQIVAWKEFACQDGIERQYANSSSPGAETGHDRFRIRGTCNAEKKTLSAEWDYGYRNDAGANALIDAPIETTSTGWRAKGMSRKMCLVLIEKTQTALRMEWGDRQEGKGESFVCVEWPTRSPQ